VDSEVRKHGRRTAAQLRGPGDDQRKHGDADAKQDHHQDEKIPARVLRLTAGAGRHLFAAGAAALTAHAAQEDDREDQQREDQEQDAEHWECVVCPCRLQAPSVRDALHQIVVLARPNPHCLTHEPLRGGSRSGSEESGTEKNCECECSKEGLR
jgi:hypothetical protein